MELRHRSTDKATAPLSNKLKMSTKTVTDLSAPALIQAEPAQMGPVFKLDVPSIYNLMPNFLVNILRYISITLFLPSWKPRYLIQLGGYLYRFESEKSSVPKGSPLAVDDIIDIFGVDDLEMEANIAGAFHGTSKLYFFCVSTLRKRQYYAVSSSQEDADLWIRTLRQSQQEQITRKMGHADHVPYPYEYIDTRARSLARSKSRIRNKVQEANIREIQGANEGIGIMPRGFYG
mmetsp:Transcript_9915/g.14610  ORF Transcript_9915/g.14610 Transcript_9915/m.14610 type:complete len:233 (-) Transcript_9915:351-1049(-)